MAYPIFATEIAYQSIVNFVDSDPNPISFENVDDDVALVQTIDSTLAMDFLYIILRFEEEILEENTGVERLGDDLHHGSYFLPKFHKVESSLSSPLSHGSVHKILNPLAPTHIFSEGNMANISETIPENFQDSQHY